MAFWFWKIRLYGELARVFGMSWFEGRDYVRQTGSDCWREMFDTGLTPSEAAYEEATA